MYEELRSIGAKESGPDQAFKWIWRSRLVQYDRHARLLRRWICSTLRQRLQILGDRSPIECYDAPNPDPNLTDRIESFIRSIRRTTIFEQSDEADSV